MNRSFSGDPASPACSPPATAAKSNKLLEIHLQIIGLILLTRPSLATVRRGAFRWSSTKNNGNSLSKNDSKDRVHGAGFQVELFLRVQLVGSASEFLGATEKRE